MFRVSEGSVRWLQVLESIPQVIGFLFLFSQAVKDDTGLSISNKMKRLIQFNSRQIIPYREGMNAYFNPRFHFYCKDDFNNSLNLLLVTIQIEMFTFFFHIEGSQTEFYSLLFPRKKRSFTGRLSPLCMQPP